MSMRRGMKQDEPRPGEAGVTGPRKMTLAENVILTIKVLTGFGLMGAALWGISLWKSAS